jgi:uracil-DNA glycosylase family 4
MPLKRCQSGGKSGWKWGDAGKCYTGDGAKKKALAQGAAMGDLGTAKSDANTGEKPMFKFLKDLRENMGIFSAQTQKSEAWWYEDMSDEELELESRQMDLSLRYALLSAQTLKDVMAERSVSWPGGLKITELIKSAPAQAIIEAEKAENAPEGTPEGENEPVIPHQLAKVAFVGASPSKLDAIRGRVFCGPVGKMLQSEYVARLDVQPDEVWLGNIVPEYLEDEHGNPRQPTTEEVAKHIDSFWVEMERVRPLAIVALGKTAHKALGDKAAEWVPHPRAIKMWGNSGEVERKLERVAKTIEDTIQVAVSKSNEERTFNVLKVDEEKQIVYGVVMEPEEYDTDFNWTTTDEIEKAAHFFMEHGVGIDKEHSRKDIEASVVECYIAPTDFEMDDKSVVKGSWVMAVHIQDTDEWESLKSDGRLQFSIDALALIDPTSMLSA